MSPGLGLGRPSRFRLGASSVAGVAAGGAVLLRDGEGRMCGAADRILSAATYSADLHRIVARPVEADWWLSLPPTFGSLTSLQFVPGRDRVGWRGGGLRQMGGRDSCLHLQCACCAAHRDAPRREHRARAQGGARRDGPADTAGARTHSSSIRRIHVGCHRCLRRLLLDHVVHPLLPNCGRI